MLVGEEEEILLHQGGRRCPEGNFPLRSTSGADCTRVLCRFISLMMQKERKSRGWLNHFLSEDARSRLRSSLTQWILK